MLNLKYYTIIKIYLIKIIFFLNKNNFLDYILQNQKKSKSQVFQDLFVLYYSTKKKRGSFVEIGGGNGVDISNTYLLEKKYRWKGIICEPNKNLQKQIKLRRSSKLIKLPITCKCSKNFKFYEHLDPYQSSTIKKKNVVNIIQTGSMCLNHLLKKKMSKKIIDYISIDTEGNELDILRKFNFKKFKVKIFTIEHNFNEDKRWNIFLIMKKNNYKRVFKYLSYMDDWYIKL
jgi:hypothetical protein